MILMDGLLDYQQASLPGRRDELFLFTGNSFKRQDGALVMGRGAAKQVRDMYPGFDQAIAKCFGHLGLYGVAIPDGSNIGAFQVKRHFTSDAAIDIICNSVNALEHQIHYRYHNRIIHLNFPGIGNGRLRVDQVYPLLTGLPDSVFIYR